MSEQKVIVVGGNRHYGLKIGDRVKQCAFNRTIEGYVVELHVMDNNGATIRLDDGREMNVVCEWCEVTETQPTKQNLGEENVIGTIH